MIYLDNHATTPIDPQVIDTMTVLMREHYANPGSVTHEPGRLVAQIVEDSIQSIAKGLGCEFDEVVITSGATESNNLAIFGVTLHPKQQRRRIVSVVTEHRAVLDPLIRLERMGFEIVRLPVMGQDHAGVGELDLGRVETAIDDHTALVSVMHGNNEIGSLQPLAQVADLCHRVGAIFHTDASQTVGRMPIDIAKLGIDLLSFSAHKFYGPKGIGGLYVRQNPHPVRIQPQIWGGGQQNNLRSGTLNSVGIVGMAKALELCRNLQSTEPVEIARLRNMLWQLLKEKIPGVKLNGPNLESGSDCDQRRCRLPGNLNVCFPKVDGQSLMLALPDLAMSSGSACTSADPHPSHVLRAIGRTDDETRASLRFGVGRFNTELEIRSAAEKIAEVHEKLAGLTA